MADCTEGGTGAPVEAQSPEDMVREAAVQCATRLDELTLARELFEASNEIAARAWALRSRAKIAWWVGLVIGAPSLLLTGSAMGFVGTACATACFVASTSYIRRAGRVMNRARQLNEAATPLVYQSWADSPLP